MFVNVIVFEYIFWNCVTNKCVIHKSLNLVAIYNSLKWIKSDAIIVHIFSINFSDSAFFKTLF